MVKNLKISTVNLTGAGFTISHSFGGALLQVVGLQVDQQLCQDLLQGETGDEQETTRASCPLEAPLSRSIWDPQMR